MKLKKYPVSQLQEGMVIGRGIYEEDMTVILSEGTVLDRQMISLLESRDVYFVHVRDDITPVPLGHQVDNVKTAGGCGGGLGRLAGKVRESSLAHAERHA